MVLRQRHQKFYIKRVLFIASFLAISLAHFAIFWAYINVDTIRLTLFKYNPVTQEYIWNNFENYTRIFKNIFLREDIAQARAFTNTFRAIIINLIIFPLALVTSYAFYKKCYGTSIFRVIFYLPSIISLVILTMAYKSMFRPGTGPVYEFFELFGYTPSWLSPDESSKTIWPLIYIFCILNGLSTNVILMSSAMLKIPNEIPEAAKLDGCGFFRELFTISVPLIMPTITTWITAILASVFTFHLQPMLISVDHVNGSTLTIPWQIFSLVADGGSNPTSLIASASLGIFLSLFMLPWILLSRWGLKKLTPEVTF